MAALWPKDAKHWQFRSLFKIISNICQPVALLPVSLSYSNSSILPLELFF